MRETPAGAGVGRTTSYRMVLFSHKVVAVRKATTYTDLLCRRADYSVVIYFSLLHLSHL